ncbi:MAG: hypothetical protein PVH64_10345 [Bacillota bacterium]|jgi:hypothetical protein
MATLLDYRTSIHSPFESFPGGPLPNAPTTLLLGDIGLNVHSATNIRVKLQGQIGVQAVFPSYVFIIIYRDGTQVYWAANYLDTATIKLLAVNAADTVTSSPTGLLQYRLYAYTSGNVDLFGPVNFEGLAVIDS